MAYGIQSIARFLCPRFRVVLARNYCVSINLLPARREMRGEIASLESRFRSAYTQCEFLSREIQ
jgi:hypothetical protein